VTTTNHAPEQWDIPAIHIHAYRDVPTSAEVHASFKPDDCSGSEKTTLLMVDSSEAEAIIDRHDWPGGEACLSVKLISHEMGEEIFFGHDNPMVNWQRLVEFANVASVAAQQLLVQITSGEWAR
jgi:hypothetical protein